MKKNTIILSILLSLVFSANGQVKNTFKVDENRISAGYISKKVWLEHYAIPQITLVDVAYQEGVTIPADAIPASEPKIEVLLGKERKKPFAIIRIPVYSLNDNSGVPRRISEFTVSVTEEKAANPFPPSGAVAKSTAVASVLADGDFYKIAVGATGFYRVDFDFVSSKLGVSNINSANIRVYGNGGNMLSENNADARPDDLVENPIWVSDGGDGIFNQGDFFVFYATGPTAWNKDSANNRFLHQVNIYQDQAHYFLNFDKGPGLRIQEQPAAGATNITVNDFDHYAVYEKDLVNPGTLGKEWWGEEFSNDIGKTMTHSVTMDVGALTSEAARFRIGFGARTDPGVGNTFNVSVGGSSFVKSVNTVFQTPMASSELEFIKNVNGSANFTITYQTTGSTSKGFLNFIEMNARHQLNLNGLPQLMFRDWRSVGPGNVALYNLQGAGGATQVWDVTQPLSPVKMPGTLSGGTFSFAQEASMLHEFAAFNGSSLPVPTFVGKVENQNLHGSDQVDYIIVADPLFINEANELADFHRQRFGLRVIVATTFQVYNEFSSGSQDISAIRDFARMFYERAGNDTAQMPKYLLLFGDASYDYKDRVPNNSNFVPTFESKDYSVAINSYCTDDFFSFLDDNENIENMAIYNTMDIGVGRFPVTTREQAQAQLRKIKNYKSPAALGPWRLSTTLVADNADVAGDHMNDAERMGAAMQKKSNIYNVTKIYLDAVPRISTPGGLRAPDANKAINDQIYKGTFLMNYSGHGNIQVLAEERIVIQDDYSKWKNFDKLPIIITATCDYGQFDHPEYVSSGEAIMLKGDGGAIATLTTTQLVYAAPNAKLNEQFLEDQFSFKNGKNYTMGDAFRLAKNETYATSTSSSDLVNFRKFALLGDPALTPAFPEYNVKLDSLKDGFSQELTDTIRALGAYSVSGHIANDNNDLLDDFSGRLYVTIYDKPKTVQALTDASRKYRIQNNVIYKGRVNVENGKFKFSFIAPKDINYDMGGCKMSLYAENGNTDAAGADTSFIVGGFSDHPVTDDMPPVVKPYIDDENFRDGGVTGSNTFLFAILEDETGINVSGNTVGHDLTAVLDGDVQNPYILNDYYETEPNNYKRGYVYFPITGLSNGKHSLRIKAWDVNNNSGEGTVNFEVVDGNIIVINNLMNYPNPFADKTHFVFEHNHPDEAMDVSINIYNTAGALVRTIRQNFTPSGSRSTEITWDGTGNNGELLPNGLYVYRLSLATAKGIMESAYQKLVIVR